MMMRTVLLAATALTACSAAEPQVDQKVLKKVEATTMRQQAEEARVTPDQQAERDRMVATAQLRAKMGVKPADNTIGTIGPSSSDPQIQRKTQAMMWQAMKGQGATGKGDAKQAAGARPGAIARPTDTTEMPKIIESSRKPVE